MNKPHVFGETNFLFGIFRMLSKRHRDALVARRAAQHDALAAIDGDGGHLPGMVHPQDLRHPRGQGAPARLGRDGLVGHDLRRSRRAAAALNATSAREATQFQPAMETPRKIQAG